MLYQFTIDDVDYEAEVTVTAGRDAAGPTIDGPGDHPDGAEIELDHIWLVINRKRNAELPHDSEAYAVAEKHLLNRVEEILHQASREAMDDKYDAADARNDMAKEDGI